MYRGKTMKAPIIVYDQNMKKRAYLENAFNVGYEKPMNALWTARFSLPANDPKNEECKPLRFVEIYDGNDRVELFRILPYTMSRGKESNIITYECEHVLATLIDDVLFQYHQIGNLGVYTNQVIQYILIKQTVQRWQLDTVEFSRQFEYSWENETLLAALFSIPKPFAEEYMWTFDTTVYPWRLNLVSPPDKVTAYIKYGVNMQGITKEVDATTLRNRIYGLGYGEGVNQLNFAEINGGLPYIQDDESIEKYGLVSYIFADMRFQYPETLLARCQALLAEMKEPRISYTVSASDIHSITGEKIYQFNTGDRVRVIDKELGEDFTARIVNVSKGNLLGAPGEVTLEIANKSKNIAGTIAELETRQKINEVYAQGATNIDSYNFADNCDPQYPAIIKFYIPEEVVRINKLLLNYTTSAFRAYSKAIEGGGGLATSTADGGGAEITSAAGGGTVGSTQSGGGAIDTSETSSLWSQFSIYVPDAVTDAPNHTHGDTVPPDGAHTHAFTSDHRHEVNIPSHSHQVTFPSHRHDVYIPDHFHEISIPNHTHGIEYGIFLAPNSPTSVIVEVDGSVIPGLGVNANSVDIIPYLSKDGSGKVKRGTWHEIKITPNQLGRIVADVVTQFFIQSRGGGNY